MPFFSLSPTLHVLKAADHTITMYYIIISSKSAILYYKQNEDLLSFRLFGLWGTCFRETVTKSKSGCSWYSTKTSAVWLVEFSGATVTKEAVPTNYGRTWLCTRVQYNSNKTWHVLIRAVSNMYCFAEKGSSNRLWSTWVHSVFLHCSIITHSKWKQKRLETNKKVIIFVCL